jgi:BolA family transcriptional regulator, general stress-responsive regulator
MNNQERIKIMHALLEKAFKPDTLEIEDESHFHVGHAGAKTGKGHFKLSIRSETLNQLSKVKAHQEIYKTLNDMMQSDIHALSINVLK